MLNYIAGRENLRRLWCGMTLRFRKRILRDLGRQYSNKRKWPEIGMRIMTFSFTIDQRSFGTLGYADYSSLFVVVGIIPL